MFTKVIVLPKAHAAIPTCFGRTATIVGTDGPDALNGTPGTDVIVGLGGGDYIVGAEGDDFICGNGDNDSLFVGDGSDRLNGGSGDDLMSARQHSRVYYRPDSPRLVCRASTTRPTPVTRCSVDRATM